MLEITDSLTVEVQPSKEHEWLLSTQDVARGYGITLQGVRMVKQRNADEFEEGKHYLTVTNRDAQRITGNSKTRQVTMWTKRGVVRLGFFIKTPQAKQFRDWAEDEFEEGKHYLTVTNRYGNPRAGIPHQTTMWTKIGVVMLGFFIKSPQAVEFRRWASRYIVDGAKEEPTKKLPTTYLEALEALIERERKLSCG